MLCQKMELNKAARKRRKSIKSPSGFKKAPQAPRRFKSPYILFSISKIQEYKRIYKNAKVTSFSSLISKEWKALSEEERNKWKSAAEQDKLRYNAEKLVYKGPWQVPSDRPRKDPTAPKRPPSAFLNYSRTRRTELIEENPHVKNTDISKLLGMEWRSIPQEMRQPHIDKEAREREVYHRKISEWRKQQELKTEIAAATESMSSLMKKEQTSQVPRSQSLPAVFKPMTIPSCPAKVTPPQTVRKAIQSSSFSVADRTPTNFERSIHQRNQVWPSLPNIHSSRFYPTETRSNINIGMQNFRFPNSLPAPPLLIPEPQPIFPCLVSRKGNFPEALSINADIPMSYVSEPTLVTPSSTPISTTDYQELFFPHVLPEENDNSTDDNCCNNNNNNNNQYYDFLLNASIEGTDWKNVESIHGA